MDEKKDNSKVNNESSKKTVLGLSENMEGAICYALVWVSGIALLFVEKENKNVRFHAMQSFLVFFSILLLSIVSSFIPLIGWLISFLAPFATIVLWIYLTYNTYIGNMIRLPFFADLADKQLNKKQ